MGGSGAPFTCPRAQWPPTRPLRARRRLRVGNKTLPNSPSKPNRRHSVCSFDIAIKLDEHVPNQPANLHDIPSRAGGHASHLQINNVLKHQLGGLNSTLIMRVTR